MGRLTLPLMPLATKAVVTVLFVSTVLVAGTIAGSPSEIDFSLVKSSEPGITIVGGTGSGGGVGGTGTSIVQNLSIKFMGLPSSKCDETEQYVDLQLSNNGSSPLLLPWSPDGARVVKPEAAGENQIIFDMLSVTVRNGQKPEIFVSHTLFGSRLAPESILTLAPGGSALLKNISLKARDGKVCGSDLAAEVALSSNQASKVGSGYSLRSQERWRVESR